MPISSTEEAEVKRLDSRDNPLNFALNAQIRPNLRTLFGETYADL